MALTLKFLSRAPCTQQVLGAATPKSLRGALTPKTPRTPKTPFTPSKSPFFYSCSSPSFHDVDTPVTAVPTVTQKSPEEMSALRRAALQAASAARQHFLEKKARQPLPEEALREPLPTLLARRLRRGGRQERRLRFADADAEEAQFPVLLGRAQPEVEVVGHSAIDLSEVEVVDNITVEDARSLPILLGRAYAEVAPATQPTSEGMFADAGDDARAAAERARQCFLARESRLASRSSPQVP
eukprot:TRINITY_DN66471_c0_g1_i1.p1 TRINITY_DN66471_c0_g1~~TRINITY_DN66471_c0_g1_i1.p1  ORF type:complete len:241 (+),score=59.66 TRINITY_DN66471_c0_g1_i1:74-796(+)